MKETSYCNGQVGYGLKPAQSQIYLIQFDPNRSGLGWIPIYTQPIAVPRGNQVHKIIQSTEKGRIFCLSAHLALSLATTGFHLQAF